MTLKKTLGYIRDHLSQGSKRDNILSHAGVLLFISVVIAFNYAVFEIEDDFIDTYFGSPLCVLLYFCFYALAYYISLWVLWLVQSPADKVQDFACLRRPLFWVKSLLFLAVISLDAGGYFHAWISNGSFPFTVGQHYFIWYGFSNLKSFLIVFLSLVVIKFSIDRSDRNALYGMTLRNFSLFPYFLLLLLMLPLIYIASLQGEFQDYYPIFKPERLEDWHFLSKNWQFAILEFFYALDFVGTEWIFRGALITGMASLLGRHTVLPMVAVYAFLHFGKPMGETIGSVFGGYILGVFALRSGSIFGGILIHIGVAFMMDFFALLQR